MWQYKEIKGSSHLVDEKGKIMFPKEKKSKKSIIIKIALLLLSLVLLSGLFLGMFFLTGILSYDGGLVFNVDLFTHIKNEWWFYILFIVLVAILNIALCFIPVIGVATIVGGLALYGSNIKSFLLIFAGIILGSYLLYFIGRFGGKKLIDKIFGKEESNKAAKLLKERGTVYFPAMMLFPVFPDDALCGVAGISKMNFWFYSISIILGRGIGIATYVFGIKLIPYQSFNGLYDWLVCITVLGLWIIVIFKLLNKLDKWLDKRRKKNETIY